MQTRERISINSKGHLQIGGIDSVELAKQYGTPLYVLDDAIVRNVCKGFTDTVKTEYPNSLICYASKAFSCKAIYKIVNQMGLGCDVVSFGELKTALAGGMSADKIYFHGNNKSIIELECAVSRGIAGVVVDNVTEIDKLDEIAKKADKRQQVLVRVNPGIDAHTHHYVQTTRVDSKFGFSINDGTALEIIKLILTKNNLEFAGIHCHIGSQIFELKPFELAVEKMTDFIVKIKQETGIIVKILNLGGGYGVTYTSEDAPLKPVEYVQAIISKLKSCIQLKKIDAPKLILEPGRSIVGEAGTTLYTVGSVKDIIGIKKYVNVDGGMFENPRYTLYQSKYDAILASNASAEPTQTVTIAGKCCESGDILAADCRLPDVEFGDILAILTTGAYHYSMASNYNRNLVPPVVLVKNGKSGYIVKPQTYEDLLARDCTDILEDN